jgi:hypothetical protein
VTGDIPGLRRRETRARRLAGGARTLTRLAVVAAAAATLAAGCSSGNPVNTGPFGGAGNGGLDCVPFRHPSGFFTQGFDDVSDNWRGTVAVISKVGLVRPRGLRLVHAYAVRLGDEPAYGDIPGPPSVNDGGGGPEFRYPAWKHHVNATGTRVRYVRHLAFQTNLLLVLKVSALHAGDQGINVWYHVGTQQYHLRTRFGLKLLAAPGDHC